ncbi:hypothetical protein DFH27DRAFT_477182 [Peziza echinospora]|nr:hypothetical protein DFH27DRAFT_477182 [Peziza echinospora]
MGLREQPLDGHTDEPPSPPLQKPLNHEDLVAIFHGAPQFALQAPTSTATPLANLPIPTVTFPYTPKSTELPPALDHVPFPPHPSFSLSSTAPYPGRGLIDKLDPLPLELPPMSSFQGLEVGSCGWEHFILSPVGDVNNTADDEDDRDSRIDLLDEGGRDHGMTLGGRELAGVMRSVEIGWVVERLQELGELYWVGRSEEPVETPEVETPPPGILSKYNPLELYTNLFTQLLYPPTRITTSDVHDPYSLRVQIAAITHALGLGRGWLDFSLVEWRIRLGQVLWGANWSQPVEGENGNNTERVWLLLQILLACELVVRLDAVAASEIKPGDQGIGGIGGNGETKEDLFHYFRQIRRKKVEWDIILARRWLENVYLPDSANGLSPISSSPPKKKGWFSSLSSSDTPPAPPAPSKYDPAKETNNPAYDALIIPRDQTTQLSGLIYFAREINWPQVQTLSHALQFNYQPPSLPSTPFPDTPGYTPHAENAPALTSGTGYFTTSPLRSRRLRELTSRPSLRSRASSLVLRRAESSHALMRNNTMGSGGWLSRSWFTGLVLPGECMVHLLISALLENDANVGEKVGWEAELYGGFILNGGKPDEEKSMWWSSFSIVGKVLGDYGGGKECMGWISVGKGVRVIVAGDDDDDEDFTGAENVSGWVAIRCKPATTEEDDQSAPLERIYKPKEVARMSCVLGRGWKDGIAVMQSDFAIPSLETDSSDAEIVLEGLIFRHDSNFNSEDEDEYDELEESNLTSYDVEMSNALVPHHEYTRRLILRLAHDVTFITALPCFPSETEPRSKSHPLHRSHTYTVHSLSALPGLSAPPPAKANIFVIDASSSGQAGEVYAKVWCSDRGVPAALLAREGRGCLSCAIREAGAIGVGVVIWMGSWMV